MPELTFSPNLVLGLSCSSLDQLLISSVENIISNILLLHSGNLEAFHLHSTWLDHTQQRHFSRQNVCKWVRYDLTSFPINFVGFPHLITCHLRNVQLTDESLVSLISRCPLLQKLEIIGYAGLGNVKIFSSTIEHLSIENVKSLSVNCPKLKILKGYMIEDSSVNGVRFYELSYAVCYLEMHCGGTLRMLNMDFSLGYSPGVVSASRFLHIMGNFRTLKGLAIYLGRPFERGAEMDVPLLNLLHMLPNLQWLRIGGSFVQELARDPIPVCLTSPHVDLKRIQVEVLEFDDKEIAIISCLLQSMPFLERMEIQLPDEYDEVQCMYFFKDILYLRRASLLARITIRDGLHEM
ncbi:hypothetical protein SUGI_0061400 [Cryptomeria japonica]|nr:hypothetical protein SUGI_0061400 [Cryptomeria japonica]